ncbi:MAG: hypothetical protein AAB424_02420 [Patescibacteria group bacterium]
MKRIVYFIGALALPIVLAACTSATNSNTNTAVIDLVNEPTNTATSLNQNVNTGTVVNGNTNATLNTNSSATTAITITSSGFSPSAFTVKAGAVVTWTNNSGVDIRVSSDPHPTHTDLPGLDSASLGSGDSYSFTFTKVGTWGYHDHFDPTVKGSVTVQ